MAPLARGRVIGQFAAAGTAAAQAAGIPALDVAGLGEGTPPFGTFVTRQAEDLAVIFYTSGTTGAPKGAMLTSRVPGRVSAPGREPAAARPP